MTRKVCLVLAVVALGWGLTVATVCALDAASGRWDDPIADVPYVVAFLAAGAAFLVAGLCRYRGGWRFIAGVMLAHLGVAISGPVVVALGSGHASSDAAAVVIPVAAGLFLLWRAHVGHIAVRDTS
jgi:hypothetical protein